MISMYAYVVYKLNYHLSGYSSFSALAHHLHISILHAVMMVEGFTALLYPLLAFYTLT